MDSKQLLIERIYDHVENNDVDKAVFACVRLSRSINDVFHTLLFLKELRPNNKQGDQSFSDEVKNLSEDAQKALKESVLKRWIAGRTLDDYLIKNPDENIMPLSVGVMKQEIDHLKGSVSDFNAPQGLDSNGLIAFTNHFNAAKSQYRLNQSIIHSILERIRTRCFNYASKIEHQLNEQRNANAFFMGLQTEVNTYFLSRSEDTYMKLRKATDLLDAKDTEDSTLLLTSIRTAIHSAADHFYPPVSGEVTCSDGISRQMDSEDYLNRLDEFIANSTSQSPSTDLMRAELNYLMAFVKRIDALTSEDVHANVTTSEAKQGLLSLYLFLASIIGKLNSNTTDTSIQATDNATGE